MTVWSEASQWHEMFCSDPQVMCLNWVKLNFGVHSPKFDLNQNFWIRFMFHLSLA